MEKRFPIICPSCNSELKAQSLSCESCQTIINGSYELPILLKLEQREQDFIIDFIQFSGSLKLMAQKLKLSYPTVRNMLDDLIRKIDELKKDNQ
jgi:hypothetical protein